MLLEPYRCDANHALNDANLKIEILDSSSMYDKCPKKEAAKELGFACQAEDAQKSRDWVQGIPELKTQYAEEHGEPKMKECEALNRLCLLEGIMRSSGFDAEVES